jgi:hypothetical protein
MWNRTEPHGPAHPQKAAQERQTPQRQSGRMFKRIELARNMMVQPSADDVTLSFKPRIAQTAKEHHFGLEAPVDRRIRNSIRVRYKARRLLGIAAVDREAMLGKVMDWLDKR